MISKRLIKFVVLDIAFLSLVITSFIFFYNILTLKFYRLSELIGSGADIDTSTGVLSALKEHSTAITNQLRIEIIISILIVIAFIALIFVLWSLFQGKIYSEIMGRKLTIKKYFKILGFSSLWFISALTIFTLVVNSVNISLATFVAYLLVVLIIYFTNLSFMFFVKGLSIREAFKVGTYEFYRIVVPSLLFIVSIFGIVHSNPISEYLLQYDTPWILVLNIFIILIFLIIIELSRTTIAKTLKI